MRQPQQRIFFSIIFVFFIIYLLCFNGIPISDDEQLFAVTARNIAELKKFNATQLYGNIRILGQYNAEPLHPFLASLWYAALGGFYRNGLQIFFFLPIIYLSISAGLLFLLILQFKYSLQLAIEIVFLCGISTIIWPYATTFFREPLILMLLLASWLIFEKAFSDNSKKYLFGILFLLTIIALALTKLVYGFVLIYYFLMVIQKQGYLVKQYKKIFYLSFCTIIFGLIFFSLMQGVADIFPRYSIQALLDYWVRITSFPHAARWQTIFLSLFSLWKGYFIYSPICVLIFILPWIKINLFQKLYLSFLPIGVFLTGLLFQVITYGDDVWTPPWSVRFLVPSVPFILIATLPVINILYSTRNGRICIRSLGVLGFAIQLNAILVNSSLYTSYLMEHSKNFPVSEYWNLFTAPAFNQWRLLLEGETVNLMLYRIIQTPNYGLVGVLWLICGILLLGLLLASLFSDILSPFNYYLEMGVLGLIFLALFSFLVVRDPFYQELTLVADQVCQKINSVPEDKSIVIFQPYPDPLWLTLINRNCLNGNWYSFPEDDTILTTQASSDAVNTFLAKTAPSFSKIWLILPDPSDKFILGERLDTQFTLVSTEVISGTIDTKLLRYERK